MMRTSAARIRPLLQSYLWRAWPMGNQKIVGTFRNTISQATCRLGPNRKEGRDARRVLDARRFPADNIVALDDCGDTDIGKLVIVSLVDANHTSMSAHENFGPASDFRG